MKLAIWTVYERPADFPDLFVARKWLIQLEPVATDVVLFGRTIQEVRNQLPPHLVQLTRNLDDDPCIVEVWL